MNLKKYKIVFFALVMSVSLNTIAQVKSQNNDIWFHYVGKNMISEKTSFTVEATMRYANGFSEKQQWFIRPSLDYKFTSKFTGSVGFTHYETYSYGDPALNKITSPENHVWIQGVYTHTKDNFKFIHRLRDENRFVGIAKRNSSTNDFEIDHYEYRNRVRYMFLVNYTLTKVDDKAKLFAVLGDEAFLNIGVNAGKTLFNQNRVIAGLGYNLNANHQLQLNYIHQNIWNFSNTIQESNPTIRMTYVTNFDWTKKE
ncbi:DUF2490 domain-containing protein [Flavobacterium sp.]|jgi:hypothetical protein|uniref:DUF2490 domain-containing protein n=1 Tax=Flavobacterium sp. TaxID=239 RepID=UPI002A7ECAED|nr:DUF2490 domain-containing protein [Flavobacterium sp.]